MRVGSLNLVRPAGSLDHMYRPSHGGVLSRSMPSRGRISTSTSASVTWVSVMTMLLSPIASAPVVWQLAAGRRQPGEARRRGPQLREVGSRGLTSPAW